jgi:PadR family transcriptional regulator PadR
MEKTDVPQGTLELLILTILSRETLHGYGISQRLAELTREVFIVNPGSLFPALYKMEQDGKLEAEWRASLNNRNAKFYKLTRAGKKQLTREQERWNRVTIAISHVLEGA